MRHLDLSLMDCLDDIVYQEKAQKTTEAEIRELGRGHHAQHSGDSTFMTLE